MRLTKSAVEKLSPPASGQAFFRDDDLKGFGVRVTAAGTKSYIVETLVGRKVRRITLGRANVLSTEIARKRAQEMLGSIAGGRDPVEEKAIKRARSVTLRECWESYYEARRGLKPKTVATYRSAIEGRDKKTEEPLGVADWLDRPLVDITADMIERRHKKLGEERGEAWANLVMRIVRALFSFAEAKFEDGRGQPVIAINPVRKLSRVRAWYGVERRKNYIRLDQLAAWYAGLQALENETGRDYLLTILLTGLRREEAASLPWKHVDLDRATVTIPDTKNGVEHVLPLSTQLHALLLARRKTVKGLWVFPGQKAKTHLTEPKTFTQGVADACGIKTTVHDLRRTFATVAESLDLSDLVVKRLLNHKSAERDVTAGYIIADVERFRKPMQKVNDLIWNAMMDADNIVQLNRVIG